MLTTIEQKLSAIKAINEEKDLIDDRLADLATFETMDVEFTIRSSKNELTMALDPGSAKVMLEGFRAELAARRRELIDKAEQLMK